MRDSAESAISLDDLSETDLPLNDTAKISNFKLAAYLAKMNTSYQPEDHLASKELEVEFFRKYYPGLLDWKLAGSRNILHILRLLAARNPELIIKREVYQALERQLCSR